MKKSNIILAVLAFVFISGFIGNIFYHKWRFAPISEVYQKVTSLHMICVKSKVLWLYGDSARILPYMKVTKEYSSGCYGSSALTQSLLSHYKGKGDTLFVPAFAPKVIAQRNDSMIILSIEHLEQIYLNGKLIKQF